MGKPAAIDNAGEKRYNRSCILLKRSADAMNEKEISEIRRRFRSDKSNITHVRGCYVNERQEIVSEFDQSLALMPQ